MGKRKKSWKQPVGRLSEYGSSTRAQAICKGRRFGLFLWARHSRLWRWTATTSINPQTLSSEVLSIGQGQRYDLVFTVPSSGIVEVVNAFSGQVTSIGQGNLSIPKNLNDLPIFDLTSSGVPVLSALAPDARFDANYTVTLGSKPGFRFGQIELIHTMNGGAFPDSPTLVVEKGQMVHVRLENKSAEYHPIHLHGHVLTVLRVNDRPVTGSPVRQDTVLVYPHQTADVAFVADNPGLWMLHCHVLIHANFGMDMMVVYPNISTPYTIGTKSGNFPD